MCRLYDWLVCSAEIVINGLYQPVTFMKGKNVDEHVLFNIHSKMFYKQWRLNVSYCEYSQVESYDS